MSSVIETTTSDSQIVPSVFQANPTGVDTNDTIDFPAFLTQLVDITTELFPGNVSMYVQDDPDYPQDRYMVIEAEASGSPEEVVERQMEWHRRVLRVHKSCWKLRLTYSFQK